MPGSDGVAAREGGGEPTCGTGGVGSRGREHAGDAMGEGGGDPTRETGGVGWRDGAGDALGERWISMPPGSSAEGDLVTVERV